MKKEIEQDLCDLCGILLKLKDIYSFEVATNSKTHTLYQFCWRCSKKMGMKMKLILKSAK